MSTEAYLVPNIADPISNRVGMDNTAVIEVIGTRRRGEWTFEEKLRSPVHPSDSPAIDELVVLMNWESAANGSIPAQQAGDAFADYVLQQRPDWISRFGNVTAVGHSRGASFVDAFTSTLGASNVLVDSVTYLDPNPNSDFGAQTPTHRDNVIFTQSLRQARGNPLIHGFTISGATNLDVSSLLAAFPGFPQVGLPDDPHFAVQTIFGDTIDQARDTSLPYGGATLDRDGFGGEYLHIGNLSHNRPLDGLHPAVGGNATTSQIMLTACSPAMPRSR